MFRVYMYIMCVRTHVINKSESYTSNINHIFHSYRVLLLRIRYTLQNYPPPLPPPSLLFLFFKRSRPTQKNFICHLLLLFFVDAEPHLFIGSPTNPTNDPTINETVTQCHELSKETNDFNRLENKGVTIAVVAVGSVLATCLQSFPVKPARQ